MIIFGSPTRYVQGAGALSSIGAEIGRIGPSAVFVLDPLIQDNYGEAIAASCREAGIDARQLRFSGECTPQEVDRLLQLAGDAPIIASAGGGKCIDAGKALANRTGAQMVTIPTIASTDAPTSHNYVMYDENHRMLGVEKMRRNPALVLVDTAVIARAPRKLFVSGIGDAIGKVYEVDACANAGGINVFGGKSSLAAVTLGRACHGILLEHAEGALAAIDRGVPDETFEKVVEATVLMSGLVFESGGLSIAHSMTRGLTAVKVYADTLHGFQVAYANIVQIRLEGRPEKEILALAEFYEKVGLPRSLAELAAPADSATVDKIAELTMTAPHIRHFPRQIAAVDVREAMLWVEEIFAPA
ncbi:MAG: glycerol dehydrogenase [Mesorhizobium sp.]|nr:glycerol dehydrogenase [Mesorhizobium sp.]MBL8577740.1 glycerol dehydrogenase [Mesorhizobium sp.]